MRVHVGSHAPGGRSGERIFPGVVRIDKPGVHIRFRLHAFGGEHVRRRYAEGRQNSFEGGPVHVDPPERRKLPDGNHQEADAPPHELARKPFPEIGSLKPERLGRCPGVGARVRDGGGLGHDHPVGADVHGQHADGELEPRGARLEHAQFPQKVPRGNGGMPRKGDFPARHEIADTHVRLVGGQHERRFRGVGLARDAQHVGGLDAVGVRHHGAGVAGKWHRSKRIHDVKGAIGHNISFRGSLLRLLMEEGRTAA